MTKKNFYEILGVAPNATQEKIKQAYRSLSKEFHPDRNKDPGAQDRMAEINQAYDCLGDEEKRSNYDRVGYASGVVVLNATEQLASRYLSKYVGQHTLSQAINTAKTAVLSDQMKMRDTIRVMEEAKVEAEKRKTQLRFSGEGHNLVRLTLEQAIDIADQRIEKHQKDISHLEEALKLLAEYSVESPNSPELGLAS